MLPKISIVTPSFNQGQYLEETIRSVLSQEYPFLEYIVIDGASTDQSVDIIKKYESKITYWESVKDTGQSDALNKGLKRATGEVVTWLNSDDVYTPGTLLQVGNYFSSHPGINLLHGKTVLFGHARKDEVRGAPHRDLESLYLSYIPFPQPSSFFTNRVLEEQGYLDETLHYGMDFDLLARIALNYNIAPSPEIFSRYRMHPTSKSNNELGFIGDWNIVFSRILRSIPGTENKISQLESLGLYVPGEISYRVSKPVEPSLLEKSFYHFLRIQAQMFYIAGKTRESRKLFNVIKAAHPDWYGADQISGLHMRATLLSPLMLKFIRAVKA